MLGEETASMALHWGADDLDGTVVLEGHDEGASLGHVQRLTVEGPWSGRTIVIVLDGDDE